MKREKQQIIFWQETHLCDKEHEKLKKLGFKKHFIPPIEMDMQEEEQF